MITQQQKFTDNVMYHLAAGYQLFYINTNEEKRVVDAFCAMSTAADIKLTIPNVITWDCANGFQLVAGKADIATMQEKDKPILNPAVALRKLEDPTFGSGSLRNPLSAFVVFNDLDTIWTDSPMLWRIIRNLALERKLECIKSNRCSDYRRPLFIVGNSGKIPDNIKNEITILDFDLPDAALLESTLNDLIANAISSTNIDRNSEMEQLAVRNMLGLNVIEAENIAAMGLAKYGQINDGFIRTVREQKAELFKKSEILTYIPEERMLQRSEIAGYDKLFDFIERRRQAYSKEALAQKIDKPRGVILLGVPGTGKSVVAKLISRQLGLPGYIMDIGAVFGSLVGESERRMRTVLKQIQAQRGCVLVLDEADKALSGMSQGGGDNGTSQRLFGQFLSFLTEQDGDTFTILTMNRADHLPSELLRPGRFDAIFYTALPQAAERQQVFDIHFTKRGVSRDMLKFSAAQWQALLDMTNGWSHAEIEAAVIESRYMAFNQSKTGVPTFEMLELAVKAIKPASVRDAEAINKMITFCESTGIPVTSKELGYANIPARRNRSVSAS